MVDRKQIKQWLKEGTITQAQAKKMLADSSKTDSELRSNKFVTVVAIVGAVLVFVGFAWLIAKNWHQIPNFVKLFILIGSTVAAFVSGVMLRQKDHEGVGGALITLGALLYVLSLFLISQIYHLATGMEHYAWLLLLAWTIILATAYFLDSIENLVVAMLIFFPWVIMQYLSSISSASPDSPGGVILSFILIFLSAGALLCGLTAVHSSLKHKFTNIYRFWMVFYFLLIFYIMSFQLFLPVLSEFSFEESAFPIFLVLFIFLCFFGFVMGAFFTMRRKSGSIKELLGFVGVLVVLFLLIIATKAGEGEVGECSAKRCYEFRTAQDCSLAPAGLYCQAGRCESASCHHLRTESECATETSCQWSGNRCSSIECNDFKTDATCENNGCNWNSNYCMSTGPDPYGLIQNCRAYNNQKDSCVANEMCEWRPLEDLLGSLEELPVSLWLLWIVTNIAFIGFILLIIWYGQRVGSTKIVNLALFAFIIEVMTRYIGFWFDFEGYFAFSILAILGGLLLILGAWFVPKWRRKLVNEAEQFNGEL